MEGKGPLKVYSAFVFDMDGTILTLPVDWNAVRADVAAAAGEPIDGAPLFNRLAEILARRPEKRSAIFAAIDAHESRAVAEARPIAGALELARSLQTRARLALVTMQGRQAARALMERFDLLRTFTVALTREDSLDRAEQLLIAIRGLGAETSQVLFVGDRLNDVVSARRAEVDVALVGREATGPVRPDYEFRDFSKLSAALS